MIGASKILTVSYGTFSCTLEGFDEPFNTMKAIAEYFRDLAAEDRYFGAEPPTPDAAMLHKIAEREIHRRVEAKIQENGVILRAGAALDAPKPAPVATTAPVLAELIDHDDQPLLSDTSEVSESVAVKLSRLRASAALVASAAMPAVIADGYEEDQPTDVLPVAAVLQVEEPAPAAPAAILIEDPVAPVIEQPAVVLIANSTAKIDQNDQYVPITADDATIATAIDPIAKHPVESPVVNAPDATLLPDETDLIKNTDQKDEIGDPEDSYDQDTQDDLAKLDDVAAAAKEPAALVDGLDDTWLSDNPSEQPEPVAVAQTQSSPAEAASAVDDALIASLGLQITDVDQTGRMVLDDDYDDDFDSGDNSFPAQLALPVLEHQTLQITEDELDAVVGQPNAAPAEVAEELAEDPVEPEIVQRARARVIKIRRADASSFGVDPATLPQPSVLSTEAEAALQAELAALEAEIRPQPSATQHPQVEPADVLDAAVDQISEGFAAEATPVPARAQRPVRTIKVTRVAVGSAMPGAAPAAGQPAVAAQEIEYSQQVANSSADLDTAEDTHHDIEGDLADEAVGRLMAQTNSALDGKDVKRRQAAIAHLKAAVASTEAERMISPNQPKDDLTESYRIDLESVVRPPRSASDALSANEDRPQPLVLVSAQRIDRLARSDTATRADTSPYIVPPRVVSPVRPRRIAAGPMSAAQDSLLGSFDYELDEDEGLNDAAINMFAETESFADFADRLGASDLPDLLEAAAVYCASVLGRPEFSRPLVLRQIATLPATADLTREDGLRVFGTLMRQGRITKTRRGQFAVTDRSPLLAEALRSAG